MEAKIAQSLAPVTTPAANVRDGKGFGPWLRWPRGVIAISALVVSAVAVALGLHWIPLADLAPLLFVAPCFAMMIMCMRNSSKG